MIPWEVYEVFVCVVDCGSFTAAAKSLKISKSVVSRSVQELEARLGIQLVLRNTRHTTITEAGRAIHKRCSEVIDQMHRIENEMVSERGTPRGKFRIAALDYFGEQYVAPVAAEMRQRCPEVDIELHISTEPQNLITEAYDVSILYGGLKDSSFIGREVFSLPHCVAASPEYLARNGTPIHPNDLKSHTCLVSTFDACAVWRFNVNGVEREWRPQSHFRSNSGPALMAAAKQGMGICRLPRLYLETYLDNGDLVELLSEYAGPPMPVSAVYAYKRPAPAGVTLFLELLATNLGRVRARRKDSQTYPFADRNYVAHA
jgi:DNA-binding transcriptional LysR family regulator